MKLREALKQKREFLSPLGWSGLTFGTAKQCRKAGTNIEQASPSGAAGGGRTKAGTGDEGLSATGTTVTKKHKGYNADASVWRVCGWNEVEDTVSPLGAKRPTLPALGRFGRLGAKRKGFQF